MFGHCQKRVRTHKHSFSYVNLHFVNNFRWYPYVMYTSIAFLFLTIFIYCWWWNKLCSNTAARTMRHYSFNMAVFLIILVLNYQHGLRLNGSACTMFGILFNLIFQFWIWFQMFPCLGYALQFFFITSFALMTAMSIEIMMILYYGNNELPEILEDIM